MELLIKMKNTEELTLSPKANCIQYCTEWVPFYLKPSVSCFSE